MNETEQSSRSNDPAARQRGLELARKAFKEFYAQSLSWPPVGRQGR
jgi:hypothetical protein